MCVPSPEDGQIAIVDRAGVSLPLDKCKVPRTAGPLLLLLHRVVHRPHCGNAGARAKHPFVESRARRQVWIFPPN
ncbi:hypothetical protein CA234_23765 [Sphingomonas sp. ABOLE]|nr:hypothetical protein CA234_23765 [Sphingomonas sp. ABOLE]